MTIRKGIRIPDTATDITDTATATGNTTTVRHNRETLTFTAKEWLWPLAYLLCLVSVGLQFPPGYLFVLLILYNRFRKDRYDFTIMLTLLIGGYGFTNYSSFHGLPMFYISLGLSVIGLIIMKKQPIVKKAIMAWALYSLALLIFAYISEERFFIQLPTIINYALFIYFIVPLMIFSGHEFDIQIFFRRLFPYAIISCAFYILDGFIINGHTLVPCVFMAWERQPLFYDPYILPFGYFPRIYPPGLYILVLCVFPLARYYKLRLWHIILILGAFAATRTFTVISGLVVSYILFQAEKKRLVKYLIGGLLGLTALYFIDGAMPQHGGNERESFLRIKSSVDQIINLQAVEDDKDFSETGSGRMAQALPKLELLYSMDKEWTGFGFLDRFNNTVKKYVIENEYYDNPEETIEVATNIEVSVLQVFITIGYIGLAIHIIFFLYLYYIERKLRYSAYFGSVLFIYAWFGIGGFEGWITMRSLMMIGLAFSAVLLANRDVLSKHRRRISLDNKRPAAEIVREAIPESKDQPDKIDNC